MRVRVRDRNGKDITNYKPRAPMAVYFCSGCDARVEGPKGLTKHPVAKGHCGPLAFIGLMKAVA
jgi:hypothetical protein